MSTSKVNLVVEVWRDIRRNIGVYFLLVLVLLSAFSVIYFTHKNRQSTSELEQLLSQKDELDIEWRNLLLEQNSLAEHSAIESKAEDLLDMVKPSAESEVIIRLK